MEKRVNIILSGGFGTRLWPLSTPDKPKQFLPIFGEKSLFQHTLIRNKSLVDEFFVVANAKHWEMAKQQIDTLEIEAVRNFLEPCPRNTAPAIAAACMCLDPDDIVLVSPSDHMISGTEYEKAVEQAFEYAANNNLVTFGLTPTEPHTGYGYIEKEGNEVKAFHEKPTMNEAQKYLEAGNFYWNSGMFAFKAGVYLKELKTYRNDIFIALNAVLKEGKQVTSDQYKTVPEESIDYAIMERAKNIKVVPENFEWYDLGSYESLFDFWDQNESFQPEEYQNLGLSRAYSKAEVKIACNTPLLQISANGMSISIERGQGQQVKELFNSHYS